MLLLWTYALLASPVTVVMMGHNVERARNNLGHIFETYGAMNGTVSELVFVWDNQDADIPVRPRPDLPVKIRLVLDPVPKRSLNARWRYCATAQTEAVVTVDDDLLIDETAITCLRDAWRTTGRVVGMDRRRVIGRQNVVYGFSVRGGAMYDMVLTRSMIVSRTLCERYMERKEMVQYVDEKMNYEDIAMNAVAVKEGLGPPLFVEPGEHRRALSSKGGISLIGNQAHQSRIRTEGLRWVTNHLNVTWLPTRETQTCTA
jgi:hypothetical protein